MTLTRLMLHSIMIMLQHYLLSALVQSRVRESVNFASAPSSLPPLNLLSAGVCLFFTAQFIIDMEQRFVNVCVYDRRALNHEQVNMILKRSCSRGMDSDTCFLEFHLRFSSLIPLLPGRSSNLLFLMIFHT